MRMGLFLNAMRQPVEDGFIRLNRNMEEIRFPSQVMIVAAANPCKCGHLWDEKQSCTCSAAQISSHLRKLTGPFSDRIDMHVRVPQVSERELLQRPLQRGLTSEQMRKQVIAARLENQEKRYQGLSCRENGRLDETGIARYCTLEKEAEVLCSRHTGSWG